jgi:uncharacterized protein (DUF1810 family)
MTTDDPHDLNRFVLAQEHDYAPALAEIRSGRKHTHWMWYVYPQLDGLGFSATARRYAIRGLDEARAYLEHPVIGPRLVECAEAVLAVQGRSAREIFGTPDDLKLCSCATLFAEVSPAEPAFRRVLKVYFGGKADGRTLALLGSESVET